VRTATASCRAAASGQAFLAPHAGCLDPLLPPGNGCDPLDQRTEWFGKLIIEEPNLLCLTVVLDRDLVAETVPDGVLLGGFGELNPANPS
jgi:hypothetical protein